MTKPPPGVAEAAELGLPGAGAIFDYERGGSGGVVGPWFMRKSC